MNRRSFISALLGAVASVKMLQADIPAQLLAKKPYAKPELTKLSEALVVNGNAFRFMPGDTVAVSYSSCVNQPCRVIEVSIIDPFGQPQRLTASKYPPLSEGNR